MSQTTQDNINAIAIGCIEITYIDALSCNLCLLGAGKGGN